jgi:hypothetical protein
MFVIFIKNWPKENNRPLGENSPNLATLLLGTVVVFRFFIKG